MELLAPVVTVTVHPRRARVTRRGRLELTPGTHSVVVAGLPGSLITDSVRVSGRAEVALRVVGVDVAYRDLVDAPSERVGEAEIAVRDAERGLAAVDGADAGDAAQEEMLLRLARRSGDRLAVSLADGAAGTARVAEIGSAVAAQIVDVAARRRAHEERRVEARRAVDAAQAELARLQSGGRSRRDAVIGLEIDGDGTGGVELELTLTYLVEGATWSTAYDARLGADGEVAWEWFGVVRQSSGEDWPECELTLSTARPAVTAELPELDPWWVDAAGPPLPRAGDMMAGGMEMAAPVAMAAPAGRMRQAKAVEAEIVESRIAASWRLARPTAVRSDDTPHRTTITTFVLPARLDHVTAPALGPDAHLRAVLAHSGPQTLPAGPVSTFLDDAFVGTTAIEQTAPGAEIELALGVDDRVVVKRELVERTAHRARFGSTRGATERWTITVTNRRPEPARVTVRDRLPLSRHADIKVVDIALTPEPTERDELGRVEWTAQIAPDATWEATVRFGVEHPKDLPVQGWN